MEVIPEERRSDVLRYDLCCTFFRCLLLVWIPSKSLRIFICFHLIQFKFKSQFAEKKRRCSFYISAAVCYAWSTIQVWLIVHCGYNKQQTKLSCYGVLFVLIRANSHQKQNFFLPRSLSVPTFNVAIKHYVVCVSRSMYTVFVLDSCYGLSCTLCCFGLLFWVILQLELLYSMNYG